MTVTSTALIDSGELRGRATDDGAVRSFLGVPYAAPPVGDFRWREPQPPSPWSGTRDALQHAASAPQDAPPADSIYYGGERTFSEDCLYLNVWTGGADEQRPVLVWFHFGAYQFGSSANPMYDGERLARLGCTVVTVNHRLGRLGFLAHPDLSAESDAHVSGNYGLLDQIAALEWVQRNIAALGGDPGNVTIGGVSAGANSVHVLRVSPLAEGLFHKAIAHSGPGLAYEMEGPGHPSGPQTLAAGEESGVELLRLLDIDSLSQLRATPLEKVNSVMLPRAGGAWNFALAPGAEISLHLFDSAYPVVDGYVLPESPLTAYQSGRVHDVPFLVGNVGNESSGLPYVPALPAYLEHLRQTFGAAADRALEAYPAVDDASAQHASWELEADRIFNWSNWAAARGHAAHCSSPLWHFRFFREPPIAAGDRIIEASYSRAFHGSDVLYVFGTFDTARPTWEWRRTDRELSDTMMRAWANFVTYGDPNGNGVPTWPRLDPSEPTTMHWDESIRVGDTGYRDDRMALLDELNGWRHSEGATT
ncbi:para-nitrobenzyl esterase [Rhodococcus sp. ABRD24]|uniref:carboxylesterase/lipase family protein n=1 Tax=Rhodococcus sp. ABRD24 TaxID=2507582 RepID=UPI00103AE285|nr:carboxylesterase family protein [Rhodococcus sp. ABRD24]QBJ97750.1 para-nitrobenzyl esterase [Rhodococcus sp. ABRD24]